MLTSLVLAGNATTMGKHVNFYNKLFSSEEEAYNWVINNHRKWGSPYACSFYLPKASGERAKAKIQRAKEKLMQEKKKKMEFMNEEVKAFLGRSSELVGCKGCGSKLSRKHFASSRFTSLGSHYSINYGRLPECPLCSHPLLSNSAKAKLVKLNERVEKAEKALEEAQKPAPSKEIGWVVGGWAAC
ncbi:hypothetical protein EBR25_09640 [bacterium]|nr:hypothetical protein [bacterium]